MKTSRFALAMALVLPVSLLAIGPAQASDDPPQGRKDKGAAPAGVSAPEVARGVILRTTTRSELARARAVVDRLPVDVTVARTRALTPTSDLLLFDELVTSRTTAGAPTGVQVVATNAVGSPTPSTSSAAVTPNAPTPGGVVAWGSNYEGRMDVPVEARTGVTAVAAGWKHALAVKDGRVIAWGGGEDFETVVPDEALSGVTDVAAGDRHSLALKGGRVIAWGRSYEGQTAVPASALSGVTAIAAADDYSLALKDGRVIAWGESWCWNELPDAVTSGVTAIAAGEYHALAVKDGRVIAWGCDYYGETTVPLDAQAGVSAVAVGDDHSLALRDGRVIAWGRLTQWGLTTVPPEAKSGVTAIAAGSAYSLALKDGRVIAWGDPDYEVTSAPAEVKSGILSIAGGSTDFALALRSAPPAAPTGVVATPGNREAKVFWTAPSDEGGSTITSYAVTSSPGGLRCSTTGALSCTVPGLTNGTSYTFSVTATNSAGPSSASLSSLAVTPRTTPGAPTGVQVVAGVQRVSVSWSAPTDNGGSPITGYAVTASPGGQGCTTTVALSCEVAGLSASSAYAFSVIATNVVGSSGSSTASSPVTPRSPVPGGAVAWGIDSSCGQTDTPAVAARDISALAGGWNFSVALAGGRVVAWGCDDADELVVPNDAQTGVTDIATGFYHAMALREGRVLAWGAWGDENYGQANVPSEALSGVSAISAGGWTSMALKSGRVIAWGNNLSDQASVPQDALNGVSAIANGVWHSLALKDGRVIAWGTDDAGQSSVPTEAQSGVSAIAAGTWHSLALKDGRVIAWGAENDEYDFGQARVPSEAKFGVVAIAAGDQHSVALKADGRVIAWGGNEFDQASVPSVAQAGVVAIAAGGLHTLALRSAPPAAPTQVVATPGNGQVAVSWRAPSDLGGSTISSYTVAASPGDFGCSTTGALTCTVTGLTNGTTYTFTVIATNGVGTSLPSFASSPVTPRAPVTLPGAVTALRATPQRGAVRFTWATPSSLGGASSVTYEHRVGTQNWVRTTGTAVTVRGRAGTRITVQVRAVNAAGPGPASTVTGTPR